MTAPSLRPLRKRSPKKELYTRKEETERTLLELLVLPDDALLARCEVPSREIVGYVPSECLVYLVRNGHGANQRTRERIFALLAERARRRLPRRSVADDAPISLTRSNVADEMFGRFLELLIADREHYDERLDACEICFDMILKRRYLDAHRKVHRCEDRTSALEIDDSTGEVSEDLKDQGGSIKTDYLREIEQHARCIDVDNAIDQLPELQRNILHLVRRGYPLYSEDPNTLCISKMLKKSDKTVRSHLQQATATLKSFLNGEKSL